MCKVRMAHRVVGRQRYGCIRMGVDARTEEMREIAVELSSGDR